MAASLSWSLSSSSFSLRPATFKRGANGETMKIQGCLFRGYLWRHYRARDAADAKGAPKKGANEGEAWD